MRSKQEIETLLDLIKGKPRDTDELKGQEFALEWVLGLKSPKSAMCEANSNAVLAEVRARIESELAKMIEKNNGKVSDSLAYGYLRSLSIIDEYRREHFS